MGTADFYQSHGITIEGIDWIVEDDGKTDPQQLLVKENRLVEFRGIWEQGPEYTVGSPCLSLALCLLLLTLTLTHSRH